VSYLPRFLKLQNSIDMVLPGDFIIAEEYGAGPSTKSVQTSDGRKVDLIIAAATDSRQLTSHDENKPMLMRVLFVGQGYYNDASPDSAPVLLDVQPGFIIEVPKIAPVWRSEFCGIIPEQSLRIGRVSMGSVLTWWPSEDAYKRTVEALRGDK
jgi:hypothetical protein